MGDRKRKAPDDDSAPRPSIHRHAPAPSTDTAQQQHTIDNLEAWPCTATITELTPASLPASFTGLSVGQQHMDLWVVFTAKYTEQMVSSYEFWIRARNVTIDELKQWNHGPELATIRRPRSSGGQSATRIIKQLRLLEQEARARGLEQMRQALLLMELDYLMLMWATKIHVLEDMIPDHKERLEYIKRNLPRKTLKAKEGVRNVAEPSGAPGTAEMEAMVLGFRQQINPDQIPQLIGHERIAEDLEDLMAIPYLFQHLSRPDTNVGFHGILLFGPPGTGKTLLAQTLAAKQGLAFFNVPTEQLTSEWVGDTEKIMRSLFTVAKANSPAILFFDEVDYLIPTRSTDEASFDRRAKNQLLGLFSKLAKDASVLIMGATNRPWDVDSAFLSRFQQRAFFDLPSHDAKRRMLVRALHKDRHVLAERDFEALAQVEGYTAWSGRDIEAGLGKLRFAKLKELMRSSVFAPVGGSDQWEPCLPSHPLAKRQPFKEWVVTDLVPSAITKANLISVLNKIMPSTTDEELSQHRAWAHKHDTSMDGC